MNNKLLRMVVCLLFGVCNDVFASQIGHKKFNSTDSISSMSSLSSISSLSSMSSSRNGFVSFNSPTPYSPVNISKIPDDVTKCERYSKSTRITDPLKIVPFYPLVIEISRALQEDRNPQALQMLNDAVEHGKVSPKIAKALADELYPQLVRVMNNKSDKDKTSFQTMSAISEILDSLLPK